MRACFTTRPRPRAPRDPDVERTPEAPCARPLCSDSREGRAAREEAHRREAREARGDARRRVEEGRCEARGREVCDAEAHGGQGSPIEARACEVPRRGGVRRRDGRVAGCWGGAGAAPGSSTRRPPAAARVRRGSRRGSGSPADGPRALGAELVAAIDDAPASLRPPGILIDADDAETFADDIPQFAAELAAERDDDLEPARPVRAARAGVLPDQDVYVNDYYLRQWGRASLRGRSEHVDEFGLDPSVDARSRAGFEALFRRYFRAAVSGIEHVPASGRALLVANHSGTFPWDGVMLKTAIRLEHPARRELRWLTEDFVYHFPFLGTFLSRIGAVRANPENAERLLARDALVAVFPEGIQGIGKLYRQRYQLQRFGRGGYVKLALRSGAPLVPTAIVGAEETNPLLFKVGWLSKLTGLPYLPVTATFPWLGPLGLVPLPARWKVVFGSPIDLSEYGPEGADDAILVNRLNERVRATIQTLVDDAVSARGSVLFG
jgi:1-acyl-sn-glycerol-3-phosphate acyltransferase